MEHFFIKLSSSSSFLVAKRVTPISRHTIYDHKPGYPKFTQKSRDGYKTDELMNHSITKQFSNFIHKITCKSICRKGKPFSKKLPQWTVIISIRCWMDEAFHRNKQIKLKWSLEYTTMVCLNQELSTMERNLLDPNHKVNFSPAVGVSKRWKKLHLVVGVSKRYCHFVQSKQSKQILPHSIETKPIITSIFTIRFKTTHQVQVSL